MLRFAGLVLLGAVLIALLRVPIAPSDPEDALAAAAPPPELPADVAAAAPGRLAKALSFPTLSSADAPKNHVGNSAPFQQLHRHLEASFPAVYKRLRYERASGSGVARPPVPPESQLPRLQRSACRQSALSRFPHAG